MNNQMGKIFTVLKGGLRVKRKSSDEIRKAKKTKYNDKKEKNIEGSKEMQVPTENVDVVVETNIQKRKDKDRNRKEELRKMSEYNRLEREKTSQRMKKLRKDVNYRTSENEKNKLRIAELRNDDDFKTLENEKTKLRMTELRNDDVFRTLENKKTKLRMAELRNDDDFRTLENKKTKLRMAELRNDDVFRTLENEKTKLTMAELRNDDVFRTLENEKTKLRIAELRNDDVFRTLENEKTKLRIAELRNDDVFRMSENETTKLRIAELRNDNNYRLSENEKNKTRMKQNREDELYSEKEQQRDKFRKMEKRSIDFFRFRQNMYNNLIRSADTSCKLQLQFIKDRSSTPQFICCSCEGVFFQHSVRSFSRSNVSDDMYTLVYNVESSYVCNTCYKYISKGKIPKLATSRGLKFPVVPDCLKQLTSLEERMVAPYINFMQIRPLKPYSLNPQLSMLGSVVNIAVEIDDMLQILPRTFDNMATIQVKLKRHVLHKSDYMFETICQRKVLEALQYLVTTPLYKAYNIEIDKQFLELCSCNTDKYVDNLHFVVDKRDIEDVNDEDDLQCVESFGSQSDVDLKGLTQLENFIINNENKGSLYEINDEVLLMDRNLEVVNSVKVIAPGQNKKPSPWLVVPDLEELCFPTIFAGQKCNIESSISYSDRVKSEIRRRDRRSCVPTRLFFMAKKKMELLSLQNINVCLRKAKSTKDISVGQVMRENVIDEIVKFDDGYKILKQIRSSPAYWETRKKELMATIRQLGKPTFFLTLTAAENWWPELLQSLVYLKDDKKISLEEAFLLEDNKKTDLVRNDPVTCARYFDYKVNKFMAFLKKENSIFGEHTVLDSYERVEFQQRGSPHEHIFLWLDKCPVYDPDDSRSIQECENFIDKFVCCQLNDDDPYVKLQYHKHTHTCYKKSKGERKCRFNFPIPVMNKTTILQPLPKEYQTKELKTVLEKINRLMEGLYKNPKLMSFEEILQHLEIDENTYKKALRINLQRPQAFLKRTSLEVGINCYNKDILHLFEANIDLQFVLEEYGIASYIINYVSKIDNGLSKLLRMAAEDANNGNISIKDKFRKITNVFLNSNLMSAQEAAYHCLSLPLSKSSRIFYYINTSPRSERVQMLKSKKQLAMLPENSTDIFVENILSKYSSRTNSLENVCLADFVANYKIKKSVDVHQGEESDNSDAEVAVEDKIKMRGKSAIIRYRRYKYDQDSVNYCREQVMLFLPWRDEETDLENVDILKKYTDNRNIIETNRKKYAVIEDEALEQCLKDVENQNEIDENNCVENKVPVDVQIDILQQGGIETVGNNDKTKVNRFTSPQRIPEDEMFALLRRLNPEQKQFVMHVLHCFKTGNTPLKLFLSGSAGVGKSLVITTIYQLITHYFDNLRGSEKGHKYVLLCAPSGKAAFLIQGVTLHTAFALPVAQFGGNMPELSADMANTIREKLFHLKLLIIDEISMVGSTLFSRVDTRLRQIFGVNESFGGISVIVVGDLNQLPPVLDSPVYKVSKKNEMSVFFDTNPLWEEFRYYELTKIMRQKDEVEFIEALNNLATGKLSDENIKLLRSREVEENCVPNDAIRLYFDNNNVDKYNKKKIDSVQEELIVSVAEDIILGKMKPGSKRKALESLKHKKVSDTSGLPYKLLLKVGIKYMATVNVDVEDGIVNGACGILKMITFKPNTKEPHRLWFDFSSQRVGNKARLLYKDLMSAQNIDTTWTPVDKMSLTLAITNKLQHQTVRKQFPIIPAEAQTIHKSQGQTYEKVCFDFRAVTRLTQALLYVALSRVTKLSGLFILGTFKAPKQSKDDSAVSKELARLKTEKKLKLCFDTLNGNNCIKIIYQNVGTLHSKIDLIQSDEWYSKGDIIIFSETLTKISDVVQLETFDVFFRSDITNDKSRGLVCFLRKTSCVQITNMRHVLYTCDAGSVEFLSFLINGQYCLVTGYKSPHIKENEFLESLEDIITADMSNNLLLMGDFNFNIFKDDNNETFLKEKMISRFNLRSLLPSESVTTNLETQIDVIFSNMKFVRSGVYETYFSYHKPIFSKIYTSDDYVDKELTQHNIDIKEMVVTSFEDRAKNVVVKGYRKTSEVDSIVNLVQSADFNEENNADIVVASVDSEKRINANVVKDRVYYINQIPNKKFHLEDRHIEMFHTLLRKTSKGEFNPVLCSLYQLPIFVEPLSLERDHIQIMFIDLNSPVGHWICTYYNKESREINIYDSGNMFSSNCTASTFLKLLFPTINNYRSNKVQKQTNGYDCGVFAIAFATTLYLRQDPVGKKYKTKEMREHLVQMLQTERIEAFPEYVHNAITQNKTSKVNNIVNLLQSADLDEDNDAYIIVESEVSEKETNANVVNNRVNNINKILDNKFYLDDSHIEMFYKLLKETSKEKFDPVYCLLYQIPCNVKPLSLELDHIQIMIIERRDTVGHWICTYYKKETREIYIYDSLNMFSLNTTAGVFLRLLFPTINNYRSGKVQKQTNGFDCGVFAIAFATTLYLGQDPVGKKYKIRKIREHLVQMLQTQKIEAFPEEQ